MPADVTVVDHPLVQHKLTELRRKETVSPVFRRTLREISFLLAYEATRDLGLTTTPIETPLVAVDAPTLGERWPVLVSILRAGNALLDGMMELMPEAPVGHIGLYREPETLVAVEYYCKLPEPLAGRRVVVVDPMLATGNSAVAAVGRIKENGADDIKFVSLLAAPEGIEQFRASHPDVDIYTAAIDERLDEHGYIVPGLGDAGDRIFGTK